MTLHQPMYNLDQQNFHELYLFLGSAGAFLILSIATLLVISKILRMKFETKKKIFLFFHKHFAFKASPSGLMKEVGGKKPWFIKYL